MTIMTIHAYDRTNNGPQPVLFQGDYPSLRHCVEAAVAANVSLRNSDLRGADLRRASLDGADLRGCRMEGSQLFDANLSECDLSGAQAQGCDFAQACLAGSRMVDVDFQDAAFAGTIVTGAHLDSSRFSCPTCFTLAFAEADCGRNIFMDEKLGPLTFSGAPVVVTGLPERLVFLDDFILIGNRAAPRRGAPFDRVLQDMAGTWAANQISLSSRV